MVAGADYCGHRQPFKRVLDFDLFFHAVTLPFNQNGFGVMQQPVQDSGCKRTVVIEDFRPVLKRPVGSDNQSTLFVPQADDLEQMVGPGFIDG